MTTTEFSLTDEELALLPTDDEVMEYAERGWYLTRKLLTDDEADALRDASERFYAGERSRELPSHPANLAYWKPEHGAVQRHNDYVHYESDEIGAILRKPIIGAVAARLAEASEMRIFQSTLIYKPPRPGEQTNLVPWHFDKHYWATCTSDRMLTAFIPFHDLTEEHGPITMVDGSNTWKEIGTNDSMSRHFAHRSREELDQLLRDNAEYNNATIAKLPMLIPKGHMSFHHCRTYHGSGHNLTDGPRRSISLHLQDGANRYQQAPLSDGSVVVYNHDELVRRADNGMPDYADPDFCPVIWRSETGAAS
ncbi:MAG: phytanoyl-CoA dioxygenase family protein [Actinocatenispora sp.]